VYQRTFAFISEQSKDDVASRVHLLSSSRGTFDIEVEGIDGTPNVKFSSVQASLESPTTLTCSLGGQRLLTTIVSQPPPADVPASNSPATVERLHVFQGGTKTTLVVPPPKWLLSLGGEILDAAKKGIRAPMPSVVVEVKVNVGDKVTKGQAIVVLESMKTESVLRSERDGQVVSVACKKGEMVAEGKELVVIVDRDD